MDRQHTIAAAFPLFPVLLATRNIPRMTHTTAVAAVPPRDEKKRWSRAILIAAAILAPAVILIALVTRAGLLLVVSGGAVALVLWSLLDIRATFLIAVLLATFVDYETGHLTLEMTVLCAWFAWISLLLSWRSTWMSWVRPRS